MTEPPRPTLNLTFAGRIIEHLGIQMYQSPTAALAELVANAWDADSPDVDITLPAGLDESAVIVVQDHGHGMTFDQCEERFLHVGRGRRGGSAQEFTRGGRPVLGRKGIGKFAGFGIARSIRVDTTSAETNERTVFELDFQSLRGEEYAQGAPITILEYDQGQHLVGLHGTTITLGHLTLGRTPSPNQIRVSMARRFLLMQWAQRFSITINREPLADVDGGEEVEYDFPADYPAGERPDGVSVTDTGWGRETVAGHEVEWRVRFFKRPIQEPDLRGWAVFAGVKLAQAPFFFDLRGGAWGQGGAEYFAGQVKADYIDTLSDDVIATERQRINWLVPETEGLAAWGRARTRELLRIWQDQRAAGRVRQVEARVEGFSARLAKLGADRNVVSRALHALARIPTLTDQQFEDVGSAVVTAWEQGRLRDLIRQFSEAQDLDPAMLVALLAEAKVLAALNAAEAVKTKLVAVKALSERVAQRDLENPLRDAVGADPWIIDPRWETFRIERGINGLIRDCAAQAGMSGGDWDGRVDLVLASNRDLLVLEFMRPGLTVDFDHVNRWERYIRIIRERLAVETAGPFYGGTVYGHLIADGLAQPAGLGGRLAHLASDNMVASTWRTVLSRAVEEWRGLLEAVVIQGDDARLRELLAD